MVARGPLEREDLGHSLVDAFQPASRFQPRSPRGRVGEAQALGHSRLCHAKRQTLLGVCYLIYVEVRQQSANKLKSDATSAEMKAVVRYMENLRSQAA